jgi:hypothetical protein
MKNMEPYEKSLERQIEELQLKLSTAEAALDKACSTDSLLNELKHKTQALERDYLLACQMVAQMHAAARGRWGIGPKLGVVEDVQDLRRKYLKALKTIRKLQHHT